MSIKVLTTLLLGCLALAPFAAAAQGVSDDVVKIGILTDLSGPFSDFGGPGSVAAAELAVEDFNKTVLGKPVEVISANSEIKPDVASTTARQWFDVEKVDMINDLTGSPIALAISQLAKAKNRIAIVNGAALMSITNEQCNSNTIHYAYNVYSLASTAAGAIVKDVGKKWFFLVQDTVGGKALEDVMTEFLLKNGGEKVGAVRHPLNTHDFSSYLLQAQSSGAQVVVLANSGAEFINSMKGAAEFGIVEAGQKIAGTTVFITDVNALGLKNAQGLLFASAFYWDQDDQTRAFAKRYFAKMNKMPTMTQAGVYSSTKLYLQAIQDAGTDEPAAVMAKMREIPVNDIFKNGRLREDGSFVHDMYLAQAKEPEESKAPWDYYNILATVPADQAYQPLSASKCSLVKQ
ncbi:branched-chain amino acid transport system substrate-binding protein [Rhodoligotrophos appendicifer]|uniref:ABC transporter substrate-binding protein n=1 Tax=Rhodoligotrophos appendicifer TaxID=987056 RepID=UPI0011852AC1|nr:ABC transporter substrate-binding protein [Rhodoligotrophos appendicifer]